MLERLNGRAIVPNFGPPERFTSTFISEIGNFPNVKLGLFEKKCDLCGKEIQGAPVHRYYRNFCSRDHVREYFGSYVDETSNEVFWSDFY